MSKRSLLLDTCALIWLTTDAPELSQRAKAPIAPIQNYKRRDGVYSSIPPFLIPAPRYLSNSILRACAVFAPDTPA